MDGFKQDTCKRLGPTRKKHYEHKKKLTVPGPPVHGPPRNAIMRAPVPGTQAPSNPAATVKAMPVQRIGL